MPTKHNSSSLSIIALASAFLLLLSFFELSNCGDLHEEAIDTGLGMLLDIFPITLTFLNGFEASCEAD